MSQTPNELIQDPIFQQNVLLWVSQPLPDASDIEPILFRQGFKVYAIAPLLTVPLDVRLLLEENRIVLKSSVRPDVVLHRDVDRKFAFCECKRNSFGRHSSTTEQARSLLIVTDRAADVLALPAGQVAEALLCYTMPEHQRPTLIQTMVEVCEELSAQNAMSGEYSVMGLVASENEISFVFDDKGFRFFGLSGTVPFLRFDAGIDPRPLYFIPYDPDVDQSVEERLYCKRVLFERIHAALLSAIGRVTPPFDFVCDSRILLDEAMFGMYGQWENRDSDLHMRRLCRQFMDALRSVVNRDFPDVMSRPTSDSWRISILGPEAQERIIDIMSRFSSESLDLRKEEEPELFDDLNEK